MPKVCNNCGNEFPDSLTGTCPNCGCSEFVESEQNYASNNKFHSINLNKTNNIKEMRTKVIYKVAIKHKGNPPKNGGACCCVETLKKPSRRWYKT